MSQTKSQKDLVKDSMEYYFQKTTINLNKGNTSEALIELNKGFKFAQTSKDEDLINTAYYYYAILYKELGEYEKAEGYHKKNIEYSLKSNSHGALISADYNAYGDLLLKMNKKEEAFICFEKAVKYAKSVNGRLHLSSAYSSLAQYYFEIKNYSKAKELGYQSYQLTNSVKEENLKPYKDQLIGFISETIGKAEFESNNKEVAKTFLTKSLHFMIENKIYDHCTELSRYLKQYYFEKKLFKQAYNAQKDELEYLKKDFEKKISNQKNTISRLAFVENDLLKLELAQKEIIKQKHAKKNLYTIIGFVSFLSISLIFISIILKRKNTFLKFLKQEAQESSRKKSEFIDMITHELRTPLYTILGTTQFLSEENKDYKNKFINTLNEASTSLLSLINNVLSFSKINKNVLKIENENFSIKEILATIKNNYYLAFDKKKNILDIVIDTNLPEILIGDKFKISEILYNLISNANKFTDEGTIKVNVSVINKTDSECHVQFSISDTGIGIPKDKIETIFNPFQEESAKIKKEYEGIGLGLSIVKKYISFLGSKMKIESEINKGTCITFALKLEYEEQAKKVEHETSNQSADTALNDAEILNGKRVLVVEDNKINQMLTVKILKKANIETLTADNGQIAVEQFESNPPDFFDLILMDIHMPIMDGYEATSKIRALGSNVPIITLTAVNIDTSPDNLKNLGLNYSINKPFDPKVLFNYMAKFIHQNGTKTLSDTEILNNKRVLVVEDNKINQMLTVKILKKANIETLTADNGQIAVEQFESNPPDFFDLILMDIHMPIMDGYEATSKIRALGSNVPIITLTAVNIDTSPDNLKKLGLNYSINKPFDPKVLFNYMAKFIHQNRAKV